MVLESGVIPSSQLPLRLVSSAARGGEGRERDQQSCDIHVIYIIHM